MKNLLWDLKYAIRNLFKSPGIVLVSVLSLGLGIGANLTLFTGIRSIFLRQPTASQPESLVVVEPGNSNQLSYLNYRDLRDSLIFEDVIGYRSSVLNLGRGENIGRVNGLAVTGNFFELLSINALIGRTFTAAETSPEREPRVAVLSHGYWRREFLEDPGAVGQSLTLNGESFLVLGVLPKEYRHPGENPAAPEIYVPLSPVVLSTLNNRSNGNALNVIARLHTGATPEQTQAAVTALNVELERLYPNDNQGAGRPADVSSSNERSPAAILFPVLLLMLSGLVLLIACGNVAGLLLAKAANRQREITVRIALGASRRRLIQSLLAESLVLAILGGAAGLLLTFWLISILSVVTLPLQSPIYLNIEPDLAMYAYGLGLALITGLVCGIVPALKATRANLVTEIQHGSGHGTTGRLWLRRAFVVGQVAASLALLVVCSLFLHSMVRMASMDPGFDLDQNIVATIHLPGNRYSPEALRFFADQAVDRVQGIAGVEVASTSNLMPLGGDASNNRFRTEDQPETPGARTYITTVGARYFEAMGIPLVAGREFQSSDREGTPSVVIVNKAFAGAYFPAGNALGKRIEVERETYAQIVGVVEDTSYRNFGEDLEPILYFAFNQRPSLSTQVRPLFVYARMSQTTPLAIEAVRRAIIDIDASAAVEVGTLRQATDFGPALQRLGSLLLGLLGGLGLLLAMIGLYGVMAYVVVSRNAEIGIRMALGASPRRVLFDVLRDGLRLVAGGTAIGAGMSLVITRPLQASLAGLSPTDPIAFGGAAILLIFVGLCASYIPARRATRVDPVVALRKQ